MMGFLSCCSSFDPPRGPPCLNYLAQVLRSNHSLWHFVSTGFTLVSRKITRNLSRLAAIYITQVSLRLRRSRFRSYNRRSGGRRRHRHRLHSRRRQRRAVIEANIKKRANQKASAVEQAKLREIEALDLVKVEFGGKELTVGGRDTVFVILSSILASCAMSQVPPLGLDDKPVLSGIRDCLGTRLVGRRSIRGNISWVPFGCRRGFLYRGYDNHVKGECSTLNCVESLLTEDFFLGLAAFFTACWADILSPTQSNKY